MWRHRFPEPFGALLVEAVSDADNATSSSMSVSTSQSCASPAGTAIAQCMRKTSVPLEVDDGDIVLVAQRHRRHAAAEIHPEGRIARSPFPPSDSEPDLRRSGLSQPIWAPSSTCDHLCEGRVNVRPTDITRCRAAEHRFRIRKCRKHIEIGRMTARYSISVNPPASAKWEFPDRESVAQTWRARPCRQAGRIFP